MKAPRFSDAQKAFILKQGGDGMPAADSAARPGSARRPISTGSTGSANTTGSKLRKVVADLSLDKVRLQDALRDSSGCNSCVHSTISNRVVHYQRK